MPDHVKLTGTDHEIKRDADLVIRACQQDLILHFGSGYCYNDKLIIYPSHVIENLGSTFNKPILKRIIVNFPLRTLNPERDHSKCIKKMRLCLGV